MNTIGLGFKKLNIKLLYQKVSFEAKIKELNKLLTYYNIHRNF